jgi:FdrA protein
MTLLFNQVQHGRYLDSVALMRISRELGALPGVEAAALMIGTPSNKALMREAGLLAVEGERAGVNDLVIAFRAGGEAAAAAAARAAEELLSRKEAASSEALPHARSLDGAVELLPGANLALVSVPGEFAALEARKCLQRGLHVLVFSDNVPLEEEVALKLLARDKGLLLMGPDCGTALIAGTPVAFANAVPRGDIGIVSASGTGLQEVSTLIARLGAGISHGIGVGGRDLDARVGALGTFAALDALERDAATKKIVLISKPPAPEVARQVLARVKRSAKPCIVCFLGSSEPGLARTLREAAELAAGRKIAFPGETRVRRVKGRVQGLFCGGTLCAEAELLLARRQHQLIDLGADRYTRGRPHPMIAPELRNEHVAAAVADAGVGVILVDVVLGYGSHPDPAGVLVKNDFSRKVVIASVTGTDEDPQRWSRQVAILHAAGVVVAPSNAHAAELAASLVS